MADFAYIEYHEHLGDDASDIDTNFPFMGSISSVKSFNIQGQPLDGYFLISTYELQTPLTEILINDKDVRPPAQYSTIPTSDEEQHGQRRVWFHSISRGILEQGTNRSK